jgi:hypothetical protein
MEEFPVDAPFSHEDLPEPVDIDECLDLTGEPELDVAADVTASCEIVA